MPQTVRAALLLVVSSVACRPQDSLSVVRDWLPSAVGDRWIYAAEIRGGNREHPDVARWEQEDVTAAVETVPLGVLIRRKVSFRNNTVPPRRIRAAGADESNILVHNGCVYYLEDSPRNRGGYGWDASRQELSGLLRFEPEGSGR